jgi:S-methyl-5-thioribose kinase
VRRQHRLSEASLPGYLARAGLIEPGEDLSIEPLGDGNINWVRRFRSRSGSRVVKQARLALERFPEYRAPTERIVYEARYVEVAAPFDDEGICPRILFFDPDECVLVLEDLGEAERLDSALARGADVSPAAASIAAFLGRVHAGTRGADLASRFANDEMRRLHGDHIFLLPYRPNDFPLSPALVRRARAIQADAGLVARIDAAYARYLGASAALVHGDVQAANVMLASSGPKLLDAEIAHVGDPAFDIGQLLAHLLLPAIARGQPTPGRRAAEAAWAAYAAAAGPSAPATFAAAAVHAGIELLRRTLGAARVSAVERDDAGQAVVDAGRRLVQNPPASPREL